MLPEEIEKVRISRGNVIGGLRRRRNYSSVLRMTAMIDIIFLLLIFFFVAAKWRPQEDFLPLRMPAAFAGKEIKTVQPEPLLIYISAAGNGCEVRIARFKTIMLKNETIEADLAELMQQIRNCMLSQKRYADDPVEIICAEKVKWGHLAQIYNILFGIGINDITFRMAD